MAEQEKKPKTQIWFEENVHENEKELLEIGELANRMLHEKISLGLANPMTTIASYGTIFDTITKYIKEKEDEWDDFCVNIADRIRIGYTTTDSEDDEKPGNFMVFIQHVENTSNDESLDEDEDDTIVLCTQWNAANIKEQANIVKEISSLAKKNLSEILNLKTESSEFVIPLFCIIHSCLINYLQVKKKELDVSEYELNVAGFFTIVIRETDDAENKIEYIPSVPLKLFIKDDAKATGNKSE